MYATGTSSGSLTNRRTRCSAPYSSLGGRRGGCAAPLPQGLPSWAALLAAPASAGGVQGRRSAVHVGSGGTAQCPASYGASGWAQR